MAVADTQSSAMNPSFVGAIAWASVGVVVAAALACWLFPLSGEVSRLSAEVLPSHFGQLRIEPREKGLLALGAVLGTLGALFGSRVRITTGSPLVALVAGAALAIGINTALSSALSTDGSVLALAAVAVAWTGLVALITKLPRASDAQTSSAIQVARAGHDSRLRHREHWVPVAVLTALLIPVSLEAIAAQIGYEMHVVSFIVGPALYFIKPGLVPGIDFFTQYSVGLPYLFSPLLGVDANTTMVRYAGLMVASMLLYYVLAYYVLRWLFGSWLWALAIVVTGLLLHFHTDRPFFDPSSYVLRHPLMFVTIAAASWWISTNLNWQRGVVVAGCLGASLFLNTESGFYLFLAVVGATLFAGRTYLHGAAAAAAIGAGGVIGFMAFSVAAFGAGALSSEFVRFLVEPFFIYGGGFGGWAVDWRLGWPLLYNVIAPGLCLGTLGWTLSRLRASGRDETPRLAALALLACTAIMLSAKYWNMSIVALWHVNALGFLAVTAWWARVWLEASGSIRRFGTALLVIGALALVAFADDPRNPTYYGMHAYLEYPAAILEPFKLHTETCRKMACAAPNIAKEDVALIAALTPRTGRAAVLDWNDWAYLIEARRAPKFFFLPSFAIFTPRQLRRSLEDLDLVFVVADPAKGYVIHQPEIAERLIPILKSEFAVVGTGKRFVALARVPGSVHRPFESK